MEVIDRNLEKDLKLLKEKFHANVIVDLLEPKEEIDLQVPDLSLKVIESGLESLVFPVCFTDFLSFFGN